ncbi:MAG: hypothetical protein PHV11_09290 [Candidatus Bipolaricaulis sp.]|nr:hypothetical protein [Candidatus Bipolaricaulis sp.]
MDGIEPKFQLAEIDDPLVNSMLERIDRIADAYHKFVSVEIPEIKYEGSENGRTK